MKYLFLVNPSSRGGDALKTWQRFSPPECHAVILKNILEAEQLAAEASGYDCVAAVGGDGTVNAVAHGVLQNPDKNLKFAVLYAGTSPDFCKFHGIPLDMTSLKGQVRQIPVLTANGHAFFCSCNLGMGADAAKAANRLRPVLGDKIGTFCAVTAAIFKSSKLELTVNGELLKNCSHLLITRMPDIAGGLRLALPPLQDDEYALWYLENVSFFGWFRVIYRLYRGKPCGKFRICKGTTVITGKSQVEYDGDPHGELPLEISFFHSKLNLVTGGDGDNDGK